MVRRDEFEETVRAMTADAVASTMRWVPVCRECGTTPREFPSREEAMAWARRHWGETDHRVSLSCTFETRGGGEAGFTEPIPERHLRRRGGPK